MVCDSIDIKNCGLEVAGKDSHKCRYHKKGQRYSVRQMGPKGMCIEAFHSAYPYSLALLYNIKRDDFSVRCPKGSVIFEIRRRPNGIFKKIIFYLKSLVSALYPVDPRRYRVFMRVKELEGSCPNGHKPKDNYEFNQESTSRLCPAAFDSILPYSYAYMTAKKTPEGSSMSCQDHLTNVVFKLKGQTSPGAEGGLACANKDITIRIDNVAGICAFGYRNNQIIKYSAFLDKVKCDSLFHNAYPYAFTFENGGSFKFDNKKNMIVQCPSADGRVAVDVVKKEGSNCLMHVQTIGRCPNAVKDITLPGLDSVDFPICPKLFDAAFPYINRLRIDGNINRIKVSCPAYPGHVIAELIAGEN